MSGGSASKRKGSQFERDLVKYLRAHGFDVERAYGAGRPDDVGDIAGIDGVVIEAKACKRFELAEWVAEARTEALNRDGIDGVGVVIAKAPGKPIGEAYLIARLDPDGLDILRGLACMNRAGGTE